MSHQNLKGWLEDYAENSLSAEMTQDLEQHLAMCRDCQKRCDHPADCKRPACFEAG
jgi:hypothetical protein